MRKKLEFEEISHYLENIILFDDIILKKNIEIKNQLFRENVDIVFLSKFFLDCFNIELNNSINYSFSKKTILNKNIFEIIESNMDTLKKYYVK